MPKQQRQKVKGCKKSTRTKIKNAGRLTPLSAFVRNKISGQEYFKLTNQAHKA